MDRNELLKMIGDVVGPAVQEAVGAQMAKLGTPQGPTARALAPAAPATEEGRKTLALGIGRQARALAAGKGNPDRAAEFAKRAWPGDVGESVIKALQATTEVAGGYLVTEQTAAEVIELLRPKVVVRALGTPTMPMETGTLRINKLASAATANYIGDDDDLPASQETFGRVTLTWKKLGALVPISNDLLRFATPNADGIVRDDIIRVIRIREDLAFIRGAGTQNAPKGIRNWAPAANLIPANATVNLANVTVDLGNALLALMNANVGFTNVGWMFAPRTLVYLMTVRDSLGNYAFRAELLTGKLWGYPYGVTTQIPTNLGVGGNQSEVYCVDFADIIIGESTQMLMAVSEEAAYVQNGNLVSSFSRDETLIRVIEQHDLGSRHDESIAVLTGVTWGG